MSTIRKITAKCFVCGAQSQQRELMSTNTFGGTPDLDTRPAQMMRSTMFAWLRECPECGYVAKRLSNRTGVTREWLQENLRPSEGDSAPLYHASRFYKRYLISIADGYTEGAFFAALHTAWVSDDRHDRKGAKTCRLLALAELEKLIARAPDETKLLLRADLLRRTGQFDKLIDEYVDVDFSGELANKIIAFQLGKAMEKDTSRYRVSDAM